MERKQRKCTRKTEIGSYVVDVTCDKGNGRWDYKNWRVQVSEFTNNTKCNVSFTTSEEEVEIPYESNFTRKVLVSNYRFFETAYSISVVSALPDIYQSLTAEILLLKQKPILDKRSIM